MLISNRKVSIPFIADAKLPIFWPGSKNYDFLHQICDFKGENWRAGLRRLKFMSLIHQNVCKKNYQNSVQLFDLTFNSSPNCSQNTIESYYGFDCSWLKWSNIQWKRKWSNIFFKYLSSEIMEVEKNEGRGTHFGILSYWHFAMGIDA